MINSINDSVTMTKEVIDSATARNYYAKNVKNRNLRPHAVKAHEKSLIAGKFIDYAQTIAFDVNGNLIDGQHRLLAIINTGIPAKFIVVRNLPAEVSQVIDQGEARTVTDIIALDPSVKDLKDVKYLSEKVADTKKLFTGFGVPKEDRETNNSMAKFILEQTNATDMEDLMRTFDKSEKGLNKASIRAAFLNFVLTRPHQKDEILDLAKIFAGKKEGSGFGVKEPLGRFKDWHGRELAKANKNGMKVRQDKVYSHLLQSIEDQLDGVKRKSITHCKMDPFTKTRFSFSPKEEE